MRRIILASQSPRRKELLEAMGVQFDAVPSSFDENLDDGRPPRDVAIELAIGKALDVAVQYPDCIVIGSDTIVTIGNNQLGKPRDKQESYEMLKRLSGTHNEVTTSLAVICQSENITLTDCDTTKVYFKPYDSKAIAQYIESGDGADKAGSYGIQSGAAPLIDHIEGYYDTVIGLPTRKLSKMLAQLDVEARAVELHPPVRQDMNSPSCRGGV